jgi:hypothetical protein
MKSTPFAFLLKILFLLNIVKDESILSVESAISARKGGIYMYAMYMYVCECMHIYIFTVHVYAYVYAFVYSKYVYMCMNICLNIFIWISGSSDECEKRGHISFSPVQRAQLCEGNCYQFCHLFLFSMYTYIHTCMYERIRKCIYVYVYVYAYL